MNTKRGFRTDVFRVYVQVKRFIKIGFLIVVAGFRVIHGVAVHGNMRAVRVNDFHFGTVPVIVLLGNGDQHDGAGVLRFNFYGHGLAGTVGRTDQFTVYRKADQ